MTETTQGGAPKKRPGGLNGMLIADLKAMAAGMGIPGAGSMKKAQLVDAIKAAQTAASGGGGSAGASAAEQPPARARRAAKKSAAAADDDQPTLPVDTAGDREQPAAAQKRPRKAAEPAPQGDRGEQGGSDRPERSEPEQGESAPPARDRDDSADRSAGQHGGQQGGQQSGQQSGQQGGQQDAPQGGQGGGQQPGQQGGQQGQQDGDGEGRTGRNRRRRGRDRNRAGTTGPGQQAPAAQGGQQGGGQQGGPQGGGGQGGGQQGGQGGQQGGQQNRHEPDTTILEDDVVVPAAGILDVLDNYAFVRTTGYLPGPDDVYLSLSMVRRFGLRRGDAIVGQVRHPREGERREKFNPMVRIDSVNGQDPDGARTRGDFTKLTPLFPSERLRLETGPDDLTGRVLDLVAPLGKGQRGLVLSPADAGKTTLLRSVAASVSANHPECHLMVVLVDERPEEVTELQRSVKGEVIASTFDRPPADHVTLAELAVERAKRLVELGHDVVLLLDGLTRLGRAYNHTLPASGRVVSGGWEPAALHPPKRLFGAARTIENGGSLTVLATVQDGTGSAGDEVFLESLQGTANHQVRLRADLAERGLFPAVDVRGSGTRREELLLAPQETAAVERLRSELVALEAPAALERLLDRVRSTPGNIGLLTRGA